MDILIKVLQLFLAFTLLVGIHEFGHFIMARIFRIRVEKFYIFFDPWFSLFKFRRGHTEYGLGWLPLGGYVKIAGMIDESMDKEQMKRPVQPWEFRAKPAWQRFLVMIAGVVMNVLLAVAIYCGVSYAWGESYFSNDDARWGYNFSDEGKALGFRDGDRIVAIDGVPAENVSKIISDLVITEGDRTVTVQRGGEEVALRLPLDELIALRKSKGYEHLMTLRIPFLIDSVDLAGTGAAAGLRRGDEIVAVDGERGLDFPQYAERIRRSAGDTVRLGVLRGGTELPLTATVSDEGLLGVYVGSPYTLRTGSSPSGSRFRRASAKRAM